MLPRSLLLAALVAATIGAVPAVGFGQENEPARREAVQRDSRHQHDNRRVGTAVPHSVPRRSALVPETAPPPRNGNPGRAVVYNRYGRHANYRSRTTVVVPDRRRTVIVRQPNLYYYNYPRYSYYPRYPYPYGYGAFGLGYFYYDPYRWGSIRTYPGYGYGASAYDGYYARPYTSFDTGDLKLDVSPRQAQVFVDGSYAGIVDDFDGAFQSLKLERGPHRIDISAPGYETLTFDVRIEGGREVRYRGDLRR